ncbi:hypothetical protein [Nostoc sp.]|uniref:hypothetical protein n=1 Tax=Nostoc sp. TaxID=1180 RepID=UPI002FF6CA1A
MGRIHFSHWLIIGHWALSIGHWALGIGHWALGIGQNSSEFSTQHSKLSTEVRFPTQHSELSTDQGHWSLVICKEQMTNDKPECKQKLQGFLKNVTFIYTNKSSRRNSAPQLSCEFRCFFPRSIPFSLPTQQQINQPVAGFCFKICPLA